MKESVYAAFGFLWVLSLGAALAALLTFWLGEVALYGITAFFFVVNVAGALWALGAGLKGRATRSRS